MPTIDLSNNNQQTSTTPPPMNPAPIPTQPPTNSNNNWNDPWASPWDTPSQNQNSGGQKRLSPQERVTMIEAAYLEVLGRKPDTRDINYYKYSTLSEEEIKKQLITGNEHKQLLLDGRDYKKLKDRALQAETRVKVLEGQIIDQVEEFKQLTNLLKEKNRYIQELREKLNSSFNLNPFSNTVKEESIVTNSTNEVPTTHFVNQSHTQEILPQTKKLDENIVEKAIKAFSKLF